MKKLLIWISVLVVIGLGVRDMYTRLHNLEYYSVYYASKMPHKEGTNPVLVMVMEKFDKIKLPERYTVHGIASLHSPKYVSNSGESMIVYRNRVQKENEVLYFDSKSGVYLDDFFKDPESLDIIPMPQKKRHQFLSELDDFLSEIVAVQEEPKLNLQKEFNAIYEKQFNE